jgi:Arc/MetJ-type ribon-helix-helix transcriptional regulator
MVQLVTTVDAATAKAIDDLVAAGTYASRAEAFRAGLFKVVAEAHRSDTAESILAGYERLPETEEELEQARAATIAMIAEEPW